MPASSSNLLELVSLYVQRFQYLFQTDKSKKVEQ